MTGALPLWGIPSPCLLTVAGSRAYGLARPDSDTDYRGVYIAPLAEMVGLDDPRGTYVCDEPDLAVHELRKFCKLAAAANPSILEVFVSPVEQATPEGHRLREALPLFLSRRVAQTHGGYARQQLQKAKAAPERPKLRLHLVRLMEQGLHLLETGELRVEVDDPDWLHEIAGLPMPRLEEFFNARDRQLARALESSPLPEEPDRDAINRLMVELRGVRDGA